MTYPSRELVRNHRISVNLHDKEHALIVAIANYQGKAPATVMRELALAQAVQDLTVEATSNQQINEVLNKLEK